MRLAEMMAAPATVSAGVRIAQGGYTAQHVPLEAPWEAPRVHPHDEPTARFDALINFLNSATRLGCDPNEAL